MIYARNIEPTRGVAGAFSRDWGELLHLMQTVNGSVFYMLALNEKLQLDFERR